MKLAVTNCTLTSSVTVGSFVLLRSTSAHCAVGTCCMYILYAMVTYFSALTSLALLSVTTSSHSRSAVGLCSC